MGSEMCIRDRYLFKGAPTLIVVTAGHVDHGKTSLVKCLTGTDTDRLPEEKKRGMSIDLGFAYLALPTESSDGVSRSATPGPIASTGQSDITEHDSKERSDVADESAGQIAFVDVPGHEKFVRNMICLLYTSPSPRDATLSRMPSSA